MNDDNRRRALAMTSLDPVAEARRLLREGLPEAWATLADLAKSNDPEVARQARAALERYTCQALGLAEKIMAKRKGDPPLPGVRGKTG